MVAGFSSVHITGFDSYPVSPRKPWVNHFVAVKTCTCQRSKDLFWDKAATKKQCPRVRHLIFMSEIVAINGERRCFAWGCCKSNNSEMEDIQHFRSRKFVHEALHVGE